MVLLLDLSYFLLLSVELAEDRLGIKECCLLLLAFLLNLLEPLSELAVEIIQLVLLMLQSLHLFMLPVLSQILNILGPLLVLLLSSHKMLNKFFKPLKLALLNFFMLYCLLLVDELIIFVNFFDAFI